MDVSIKKVADRDGVERFVLVNSDTRKVLTTNDVSEESIRRFFRQLGAVDLLIDDCFERARERFDSNSEPPAAVDQDADTGEDLLFELGLDEEDDVH